MSRVGDIPFSLTLQGGEDRPEDVNTKHSYDPMRSNMPDSQRLDSSSASPARQRLHDGLSALRLALRYTRADVARRPRNFCIGVLAVTLLVLFTGAVMTGIWKAPYIFLRLAEVSEGEVDIIFSGETDNRMAINYSDIAPRFNDVTHVRGVAPRWVLRAKARECDASANMNQSLEATEEAMERLTGVTLLVIDSALERTIGIGRSWNHRDTGVGEAHVFRPVLEYLQLKPNMGHRMGIEILRQQRNIGVGGNEDVAFSLRMGEQRNTTEDDDASFIFDHLSGINTTTWNLVDLTHLLHANTVVHVIDAIAGSGGKYASSLGNAVVIDYTHFAQPLSLEKCSLGLSMVSGLNSFAPPSSGALTDGRVGSVGVNLLEYVMSIHAVLNNRRNMYYKTSVGRSKDMVERSNIIVRDTVGLDFNSSVQFPLMKAMDEFEMMKSILISSFTCVLFWIILLSAILLFTLLQLNAEERQFELSIMRAGGMQKLHLTTLFLVHSVAFIVPGILLGMLLLVLLHASMEALLSNFTSASPRMWNIPLPPMLVALALGILLPLMAVYGPLSRALSSNLRDALDVYRQVQNEAKIVMIKLEELGLATWQVVLGIFLVVGGFLAYYLIPYSFIFGNTQLFFLLMDIALMVMVAGMCMIVHVLETSLESAMLWLMIWGRDVRLMTIIKKNMYDHRVRNSRAFMMLLLGIATLLSSGIFSSMLSNASAEMVKINSGSDVVVFSTSFTAPLDEKQLDAFLSTWHDEVVVHWAYKSFPLDAYPQIFSRPRLETLLRSGSRVSVVAVTEGLLNTVFPQYTMEAARDMRYPYRRTIDGKRDVVRNIYEHPPILSTSVGDSVATGFLPWMQPPNVTRKMMFTVPVVVASSLQELGTAVGDNMVLDYQYRALRILVNTRFLVEIRALMDRLSGFPSILPLSSSIERLDVLVPQPLFETLLDPVKVDFGDDENMTLIPGAVRKVLQQKLFVRLHKRTSNSNRIALVNGIQAHVDMAHHAVVDTRVLLREVDTIHDFITYFFYFTASMCVCLCTLMMWITFVANVQLNTHSLGVLCAVGCSKWELGRAIVYEALSIVLSAFLLGLLVGVAAGITLGLQITTLMTLPFRFELPYVLVCALLLLSVVGAVIGSLLPFMAISRKCIASVIRGM